MIAVAKGANVNVQTIRFYEREGLISSLPRAVSGYRDYPAATVNRVRFIKRAQGLGFSLAEVRGLLAWRAAPDAACPKVQAVAVAHQRLVEGRLARMVALRAELRRLIDECCGDSATGCPILAALDGQGPDACGV